MSGVNINAPPNTEKQEFRNYDEEIDKIVKPYSPLKNWRNTD